MSEATDRLAEVRGRIAGAARAAGRDPASVTLVAVSKTVPVEPTVQAFADLSGKLDPDKQASLGISCEACHFGGREHAELKKDIRYKILAELR